MLGLYKSYISEIVLETLYTLLGAVDARYKGLLDYIRLAA